MVTPSRSLEQADRLRCESFEEGIEALFEQRWSDGLPLVPATVDAVQQMVRGGGRPPGGTLGGLEERGREVTVWQAAVCAVMAGCLPSYFPIVLATWDAMFDPAFNLHAVLSSTGGAAIAAVASGPYAAEIGMNAGANLLGPGNRPNATIGRAVRLGAMAALDARPGELDASSFGHAGKLTFHFREGLSPSGWRPLRERLGHPASSTTVTLLPADAPRQVVQRFGGDPDALLRTLAAPLRDPSQNGTGTGTSCIVVLGPEHASILAGAGLGPSDVQAAISEHSHVTRAELAAAGVDPAAATTYHRSADADGRILTVAPEHVVVACAGGAGAGWSVVIPAWARTATARPTTRPVDVPGEPTPP